MRLILTILLIGLFKADAQMVINASAPYRPMRFSCGDTTRLLDAYPGAAVAYSFRKLRAAYTGACIRIRKDTVGQPEQDIFFDACGFLDTTAIKNFCLTREGRIVTWYDQSGSSPARNATSSTAADHPPIYFNQNIVGNTIGDNKPIVRFTGQLDPKKLNIQNALGITNNGRHWQVFSYVWTRNSDNGTTPTIVQWSNNGSTNYRHALLVNFTINNRYQVGGRAVAADGFLSATSSTNHDTTGRLITGFLNYNGTATLFQDGTQVAQNTSFHNKAIENANASEAMLGSRTSTQGWNGGIYEIIIYATDQSANRTGIEGNINTYYGIY